MYVVVRQLKLLCRASSSYLPCPPVQEPAKRFDRVDQQFKKIMAMTAKQPNVLAACQTDHRADDLRAISSELDKCQKSLSDYLERKVRREEGMGWMNVHTLSCHMFVERCHDAYASLLSPLS